MLRVTAGLALALAPLLAGCSSCRGQSWDLDTAEDIQVAEKEFSHDRLRRAFRRLVAWHAANQPELAASLRPGLSAEQVAEKVARAGCVLPDEVVALYGLADGTDYRDSSDAPFARFAVYHAFLSVDGALARAAEEATWNAEGRGWQASWFPVLYFQEESFFVKCSRLGTKAPRAAPVWSELLESPERSKAFTNLTTMLETNAVWFEQGLIAPNAGQEFEHVPPDFRELSRRQSKIHRTLNPGARYPYVVYEE